MHRFQPQRSSSISLSAKFVRESSLFSVSLLLGGVFGLLRSFLIAKWLGPASFGTWGFVHLFEKYLPFASMGTQSGMRRRIPFLRGKGDSEQLASILSTAFVTNFFCSIIYSIGVLACAFLVERPFDARALAAFSLVILLSGWLNYAKALSMSIGLYGLRSRLEMLYTILATLFSVTCVYFWDVYGAIAGIGIAALVVIIVAARKLWQYFVFRVNWPTLLDLITTGIPIMSNGILLTTMGNIDKMLIAAMLSRDFLGIYSVANSGITILRAIPSSFGQMLFVKFAEMDGQNKTNEYMSEVIYKATLILSILLALIVSMTIAIFPVAVALLLPQFTAGISAGRILIIDVFFLGISLPVTNWYMSTGHIKFVLILRVMVIIIEFFAIYLVIVQKAELHLIALCVIFTSALFSITMIVIGYKLLEESFLKRIIYFGRIIFPFLSVIMVILVQDYVYSSDIYILSKQLFLSAALGLVASLIVSVPFIYWVNRATNILPLMMKRYKT